MRPLATSSRSRPCGRPAISRSVRSSGCGVRGDRNVVKYVMMLTVAPTRPATQESAIAPFPCCQVFTTQLAAVPLPLGKGEGEAALPVGVPALQRQPGRAQLPLDHRFGELAADLGADRLARRERDGQVEARELQHQVLARAQVHLDAGSALVVAGGVLERL